MGNPMAGHLLAAGNTVTVWNRTPAKAQNLIQAGAVEANSLAELAENSDAILMCVSKTEDVESVLEKILPYCKPNTLIIDHSTIEPGGAEQIAAHVKATGKRFVDAPVTGGSVGAQAGKLTIFVGGDEADAKEAIELIKPYTKLAEHVGPSGSGQAMKMANQIAVGACLLGLCETLAFAQKAGLSIEQARRMIGGGSGGSWAFENYGPKILNKDWSLGFSIDNQLKDFGYCEISAKKFGASIPGTALVESLLAKLQKEGRGGDTTAALYELFVKE